ncbi:hypothetical protein ACTXJK_14630 [Brachybacterium tyrofermentans]|uniref:hypothetical protein n=1 Tax=Brachybacterium tyrofermentans TaxID=47848 RepID=UPI003FD223E2
MESETRMLLSTGRSMVPCEERKKAKFSPVRSNISPMLGVPRMTSWGWKALRIDHSSGTVKIRAKSTPSSR